MGKWFWMFFKDHNAFIFKVKQSVNCICHGLLDPEGADIMILQNIGSHSPIDTVSYLRRLESSAALLWEIRSPKQVSVHAAQLYANRRATLLALKSTCTEFLFSSAQRQKICLCRQRIQKILQFDIC
jgi:hypothetical protein